MDNEIFDHIKKLKHGEHFTIPESDYGKAEVWQLNDYYILFSIPYTGGSPTFEGTYHSLNLDKMVFEIDSWN